MPSGRRVAGHARGTRAATPTSPPAAPEAPEVRAQEPAETPHSRFSVLTWAISLATSLVIGLASVLASVAIAMWVDTRDSQRLQQQSAMPLITDFMTAAYEQLDLADECLTTPRPQSTTEDLALYYIERCGEPLLDSIDELHLRVTGLELVLPLEIVDRADLAISTLGDSVGAYYDGQEFDRSATSRALSGFVGAARAYLRE